MDLRNINLPRANLSRANLGGTNLSNADLTDSILIHTNLYNANLTHVNFRNANFQSAFLPKAILHKAEFMQANLAQANLADADLSGADLRSANLSGTILNGANLSGANLRATNLMGADLRGADLRNVNLSFSNLIHTRVGRAKLSGSLVYGINVWDLDGDFEEQNDLIITSEGVPITVDNIKVAQFIYLILNNQEIRDVINTLSSKTVLILGRFSILERKNILDALRSTLREFNLLPIVFDFDRPTDKDFTETIKTLAGLCYFVIADITNPKSAPLELQATIPDYQIPFVPIIQEGEHPFSMMADLQSKYDWVLNTCSYDSAETLIKALKKGIIEPAMKKHAEIRIKKAKEAKIVSLKGL